MLLTILSCGLWRPQENPKGVPLVAVLSYQVEKTIKKLTAGTGLLQCGTQLVQLVASALEMFWRNLFRQSTMMGPVNEPRVIIYDWRRLFCKRT